MTLVRPRRAAYPRTYTGGGGSGYTVFGLTPGRRKERPEAFLAERGGFVHVTASPDI